MDPKKIFVPDLVSYILSINYCKIFSLIVSIGPRIDFAGMYWEDPSTMNEEDYDDEEENGEDEEDEEDMEDDDGIEWVEEEDDENDNEENKNNDEMEEDDD